jgi:hypothetical protein
LLRLIALCGVLMALPIAVDAQAPSSSSQGTWSNDHAQFVIQSVDPDGNLTGTYQNFGLNFPASTCGDVVYPVTGWIDGDRVSFTILRKDPRGCGAVQAWAGYVRGNQLFVQFADVFWNGTEYTARSGYDRYHKQ